MGDQKRQRSESVIKLLNQRKESKLWYEEANSHIKSGNWEKALHSYNRAVELNPTEKNALVARSKCYILLGQPKKALEDAESALQIDKTFIKAVYQKAEALYFLGDFELALMYYHRGLHVRPDHEGFKLGVQKAQNAIENALGNFSSGLRSKGTSGKSTARATTITTKEEEKVEGSCSKSSHRSAATASTRKSSKNRLIKGLEADKEYLSNLLNNPDIKCKFKENNSDIETCIKETVEYLNERQEFWRQQLPPS
ncbi:unnamed protein product [Acanthoscelides obtectus]|uniref:Outer dynein arm-docking complex subunit 4 n=1 Tax=Acanthoscelides obtectus TaxID=200917 RepID=A0A9P0L8W1_ACAOB|nr:unnamed protein product [Acanthoscelides obtectus]CAK1662814.1 Tetratricopeptide repeat protein 25 [Acanthoscelides obtectus]